MRIPAVSVKIKKRLPVLFLAALLFVTPYAAPCCAMTKAELLPLISGALGHSVPDKYFSEDEGGAVTKKYGIRFYPSAALIDTEGNVKMLRPGHMSKESLAMEMKGIS